MLEKKVKELMIPISSYAQVNENSSVYEAIVTLEKSQQNVPENMHPYRAVLVVNDKGEITGKVGHLAFLRAIEPKYETFRQDLDKLMTANLTSDFIEDMMSNYQLWEDDLYDLCSRVSNMKVKDVMKPVNERISVNASLMEAMHKVIMWQTLSVLVHSDDKIVGIIRLSDIYHEFASYVMNNCKNSK